MSRKDKPLRKSPPVGAGAAVPQRSLKRANQVLTQLPDKPQPDLPMREAIVLLQDAIQTALGKGYSREDISALLNELGIPISSPSLRYYLTRLKQPRPQPVRRRAKAAPMPPLPAVEPAAVDRAAAPLATRSVEDVIAYLLDDISELPAEAIASQAEPFEAIATPQTDAPKAKPKQKKRKS